MSSASASLVEQLKDLIEPILKPLNTAQRQAVELPRERVIRVMAGAGTGKTELISKRYVKLLLDLIKDKVDRPEERLLVMTFTDEAARSMRGRILKQLESFQTVFEATDLDLSASALENHISTFHQWCHKLVRSHALELGLAPDFDILGTLPQRLLFQRLFEAMENGKLGDLSKTLRRFGLEQIIPADALGFEKIKPHFDLLDADRFFKIIGRIKASGLSPQDFHKHTREQTLHLTETFKTLAPDEVPPVAKEKTADKSARVRGYVEGWRRQLRHWASPDWNPFEKAEKEEAQTGKAPTPGNVLKPVRAIADLYLESSSFHPLPAPDFTALDACTQAELELIDILTALYARYQHALLENGVCDFDDLINLSIELLEKNPALRADYQAQYEAIIVDEFQDTNGAQLKLLELLLRDSDPRLTVVGDVKQSIYSFRFAQPENMDLVLSNLPETIAHKPVSINLETNYRSLPPILDVANHLALSITHDVQQTLTARPDALEERRYPVHWHDMGQTDIMTGKPEAIAEQKERETERIAREIRRLHDEEGVAFKDMAVLVRSHAKAEHIQQALNAWQVPSLRKKNLGFFNEPVIKYALALMQLMQNPGDNLAMTLVLQQKLNQAQLRLLAIEAKTQGKYDPRKKAVFNIISDPVILETMPLSAHVQQALLELGQRLTVLKKRQTRLTPIQLFHALAEQVGFIDPQTPAHLKVQQRNHLRSLEKLLYQFMKSGALQPTLGEILDTLNRYREKDAAGELAIPDAGDMNENAVTLMTIFASKGLEFPVVFVAGSDKSNTRSANDAKLIFDPQYGDYAGFGLILSTHATVKGDTPKKVLYKEAWEKRRLEAEKMRLFYVALTRAEDRLYVYRANQSEAFTESAFYGALTTPLTVLDESALSDEAIAAVLERPTGLRELGAPPDSIAPDAAEKKLEVPPPLSTGAPTKTPLTLSFSAIQSFQRCPVQYWLRHQWGLPEPENKTATFIGADRGKALHGLIHKHYLHQGQLDATQARRIIQDWFPKRSVPEQEEFLALYEAFRTSDYAYAPLHEKQWTLMPERAIRFPYRAGITLTIDGVIDLLAHDPTTHTHWLFDFKTNQKLTPERTSLYFGQLALYKQGVQRLWPDVALPDEQMALLHLTDKGIKTIPLVASQAPDFSQTIEEIQACVDNGAMPDKLGRVSCTQLECPFISVCPKTASDLMTIF